MTTIRVIGWDVGFNKVRFNKFIRDKCGCGLSEAITVVDDILLGKTVDLHFEAFTYEDSAIVTSMNVRFIEVV